MDLGLYLVSLAQPALSIVSESSERSVKLPTLAELYEAHRQHVYSVAFKYCGGRADAAEDVTANVFLRANEFLPNLDPTLDVRGWLYRVTKNAALSHMKSESRWRRRTFAFLQARPAEAADPESTMSQRQLADLAWQAISEFPARERAIAVLAFVDGQSQTEIAQTLDVSEATVSRSLAKIRSRVAAKGWTV
ncbi:MAG: RNA polymerase sigma factor [Kofleriaceae bacterium]